MTNYEIEKQIKLMLDKFQQSNFTNNEARRCIANVIAENLKEHIERIYNPNNRNKASKEHE